MSLESQNARDARVERLWKLLDTKNEGCLDLDGLRRGLKKLSHPLKNADNFLDEVMQAIDTNRDGKISFEEFRIFIEATELELWRLFTKIDRDRSGNLDKEELSVACKRQGIHIEKRNLNRFFAQMDVNGDGVISYEEWRDFLLFMPSTMPSLRAILSYYSSTVAVNAEGDVHMSDETLQGLGHFAAGALGGVISRSATAPFDRLRVYLIAQTRSNQHVVEAAKAGDAVQATKQAGHVFTRAMRDLWRAGGMRSLWAGNGLNLIKVAPENAIQFGAFNALKKIAAEFEGIDNTADLSYRSKVFVGGCGGVIGQASVYPLDTLKFRVQCSTVEGSKHGNQLIIKTAKGLYAHAGLRGFYKGLLTGSIGMFPYAGLNLSTQEALMMAVRRRAARKNGCRVGEADVPDFMSGAMGAISSAGSASTVYPLNVLRTRLQTQGTKAHRQTYDGAIDCVQKTIRNEGWQALYRGLSVNLLKVIPSMSITFYVVAVSKRAMGIEG